jgi:hypothetical protein
MATILHWKANNARKYPQISSAGHASLISQLSRGTGTASTFKGLSRSRFVNSGTMGTIGKSNIVNGGG